MNSRSADPLSVAASPRDVAIDEEGAIVIVPAVHSYARRAARACSAVVVGVVAAAGLTVGFTDTARAEEPAAACTVRFDQAETDAGFQHPGVGPTASELENVQAQIGAGAEPWTSYFTAMKSSANAAVDVTSSNRSSSDPMKPGATVLNSQGLNSRFIADGQKVYTQALMYVFTGQQVYRDNAMAIIRIWEQMEGFEVFTDSHIHTGIPLYRMVIGAELLRYGSCESDTSPWTDADTASFSDNLVRPMIETYMSSPDHFMNQHNYPLLGAMSGSIFLDDADVYARSVEWFTVNAEANDQGFNGSVERLFRMVDTNDATGEAVEPHVQHVEMGRDQAHGGGDITNAYMLSRLLMGQGTKVDPVAGTISDAADAVGPYEFLDDRILAAADYFWQFMQGYDTEWTPVAYAISPDGTIRDTYDHISNSYRGRYVTASFWDLYYYYTYTRGANLDEAAPYFAEAFAKRPGAEFYYGNSRNTGWDNGDGGGDFWLYIPAEAAGSSVPALPESATVYEVEERYTALGGEVETVAEGDTAFVRVSATESGSKIAYLNGSTSNDLLAFRVRTDGPVQMRLSYAIDRTVTIPDTGGQWRYVTVDSTMGDALFMEFTGAGAMLDLDLIDVGAKDVLTPPAFTDPAATSRIVSVVGANLESELSAEDVEALVYQASGLPDGAAVDQGTGRLTWRAATETDTTFQISVDDGTVVDARSVRIQAGADRADALDLALEGFDEGTPYESDTRSVLDDAVEAAEQARSDSSDADYLSALRDVVAAVAQLREISPLTADGSLDYPSRIVWSTAGADAANYVDGDNQTGSWYGTAVDLSHTFDFGADYRVSTDSFGFQSNIFADRLANSAVFGSVDGQTWTRLTPDVTTMTQDFQTLEVAPELRGEQYRYIKVDMLAPQPDVLYGIVRNLFEMNEFHIWGTRHEIGNRIAEVSLSAETAVAGKVSLGDQVDISVVTKRAVDDVRVVVQGIEADAASEDGVNWSASVALDGVEQGAVAVAVVDTLDGADGPTSYGTTDGSALFVAGDRDRRIDVAALADVTASDRQWPGNGLSAEEVGYLLFDGKADTYGDLNTTTGSHYVLDLGENASVRVDQVLLLPRSGPYSRANGTYVQGSADGSRWTTISDVASGAREGGWIDLALTGDQTSYRYLRIVNDTAWSGNLAEVELYGELQYDDAFFDERVASSDGATRAGAFRYAEEVARLRAALQEEGVDRLGILRSLADAAALLEPATSLLPEIEVPREGVVASSVSWDGTRNAADNGWAAFDGDTTTSPDTTKGAGWVQVDLGADGALQIGGVSFLPREGQNAVRANGAQIQASNDGSTWTTLYTISGATSGEWRAATIDDATSYRYLRYETPDGFANIAELVFLGRAVDRTLVELLIERAGAVDRQAWSSDTLAALDAAVDRARTLDDAATQDDADAASDVLAAALAELAPPAEWNADAVYEAGDRVAHDGRVFVAQWWTRNEIPGASPSNSWMELGVLTACRDDSERTWTASWVYGGGQLVVHDGELWEAQWWTRNQVPGAPWGPWRSLGSCAAE